MSGRFTSVFGIIDAKTDIGKMAIKSLLLEKAQSATEIAAPEVKTAYAIVPGGVCRMVDVCSL